MPSSLTRSPRLIFAACLVAIVFSRAEAADRRTQSIDAYLLIDRSTAMATSGPAAADWLCTAVVDGLLQSGDRVTVWAFSEAPERIIETTLSDSASKESLKAAIRAVGTAGGAADFSKALREVAAAEASRTDRGPIAYVLLASALRNAPSGTATTDTALLRFSRIEDHPGWKAVTLGFGLTNRVRAASAAFMEYANGISAESQAVNPTGKTN